jgi:glycosyltransferase involved in cell wall biosynthesis
VNEIPLVSIIVPCFNSGSTISRTIDSIIRQTWKNTELIIVNDGSTDELTIELLDLFSNQKNIKVHSQMNKGLAAARNSGIKISKGEYILPLDADDWLDENAVEIMLNQNIRDNSNSIVYSDINLVGAKEGLKKTYCNPIEQLFSNQLPYCMLFPKNKIDEINGYDENFVNGLEDWDLNLRLLLSGSNFIKINKAVFYYSTLPSGMFWNNTSKKFGFIFEEIRNKHLFNYKLRNMRKNFKKSKKFPSKRWIIVYFGVNLIYTMIPTKVINFLYSSAYKLRSKTTLFRYLNKLVLNKFKDKHK